MKILMIKAALGALSVALVAVTLHTAPALSRAGYGAHSRQPLATWSQSIGQFISGLFSAR